MSEMVYKSRQRVCAGFEIVRESIPSRWTSMSKRTSSMLLSISNKKAQLTQGERVTAVHV